MTSVPIAEDIVFLRSFRGARDAGEPGIQRMIQREFPDSGLAPARTPE
jgi:hypothetical protein